MRLVLAACVLSPYALALAAIPACGGATSPGALDDADSTSDASGGSDGASTRPVDAAPADGHSSLDATSDSPVFTHPDAGSAEASAPPSSCAPAADFFDGGCGDPLTDPHNCGGCGVDCDGGACSGGACVAMPAGVLVTGQLQPMALTSDGTNVYWLTQGASISLGKEGFIRFGAQVLSCAVGGCNNTPTVLVTYPRGQLFDPQVGGTPPSVSAIAVDGTNVYWVEQAAVRACALGGCGCAPATIASGLSQPPGVAAAGGSVFWTEWAHGSPYTGTVSRCPIAGCNGGAPQVLASSQGGPLAIVADDASVYWTDTYEDGGPIWGCAAGGCGGGAQLVANPNGNPYGIAEDADDLYWTNAGAGTVVRCAKADCESTRVEIASGRTRPSGIATDGVTVYWRDGDGDVFACPVAGCGGASPAVVAVAEWSNADFDQPVAVDSSHVYWITAGTGTDDAWIGVAPK